jgi:hypothetical protein
MKFGSQADDSQDPQSQRKPPPDYSSRRVQVRLLVIVALGMAMLFSFQWIWRLVSPPPREIPVTASPNLAGPEPASFGRADVEAGDIRAAALVQARTDLWSGILDRLSPEEEILMRQTLRSIRQGMPVSDLEKQRWWELYQTLDSSWEDYYDSAFLAISQNSQKLNEQQLAIWLDVLKEVKSEWTGSFREGMLAVTEKGSLSGPQRESLDAIQQSLDQAALSRVQDHTVFRTRENAAWFRIMELLQEIDDDQLARGSHGQVSGLQLSEQSEFYRGKLVRLRGTAKRGYRITAPSNPLGIREYSVLYVRPQDTDSPVVLFCLETPAGFPRLASRDKDGKITELNQPLAVTGYYFKSWVYLAEADAVSAPLLMTRSPEITGSTATPVQAHQPVPSGISLLMVFSGTAMLAITIATVVYLRTRRKGPLASTSLSRNSSKVASSLAAIPEDQVLPSTRDSLKSLSAKPPTAEDAGQGSS